MTVICGKGKEQSHRDSPLFAPQKSAAIYKSLYSNSKELCLSGRLNNKYHFNLLKTDNLLGIMQPFNCKNLKKKCYLFKVNGTESPMNNQKLG